MPIRTITKPLAACVASALLVACAGQNPVGETTVKVDNIKKSGFLEDYSFLRKGGEKEASLVYWNDKAKFSNYDKVIVEPVTIWVGPKSDLRKTDLKQRQRLADEFHAALVKELGKDFKIVQQAGPATMRLRVALTDAQESNPALDTISTYIPQARLLQTIGTVGSDTAGFVGEASAEAIVRDAQTGTILAAGVDRRAGTKALGDSTFGSWGDVQEAFKAWATQFSKNLEKRRKF